MILMSFFFFEGITPNYAIMISILRNSEEKKLIKGVDFIQGFFFLINIFRNSPFLEVIFLINLT
jgi:hypothetical protein